MKNLNLNSITFLVIILSIIVSGQASEKRLALHSHLRDRVTPLLRQQDELERKITHLERTLEEAKFRKAALKKEVADAIKTGIQRRKEKITELRQNYNDLMKLEKNMARKKIVNKQESLDREVEKLNKEIGDLQKLK